MRRTGILALAVIILVAVLAASAAAVNPLNIKYTYTGPGRGADPTGTYYNSTVTLVINDQTTPSAAGILFKGQITSVIGQTTKGPFPFTGQLSVNNIWHATVRDPQSGAVLAHASGEFSAITYTLKGVWQDITNGETGEFVVKRP